MDCWLPSQGACERLEPYAGKLARTVLRGGWRSNALFLPDRSEGANGNGASGVEPQTPANGSGAPAQTSGLDADPVPF